MPANPMQVGPWSLMANLVASVRSSFSEGFWLKQYKAVNTRMVEEDTNIPPLATTCMCIQLLPSPCTHITHAYKILHVLKLNIKVKPLRNQKEEQKKIRNKKRLIIKPWSAAGIPRQESKGRKHENANLVWNLRISYVERSRKLKGRRKNWQHIYHRHGTGATCI